MNIFIIIPSLSPAGPVKGAIALANSLCSDADVSLVVLKPGPGASTPIKKNINILELFSIKSFFKKLAFFKKILLNSGGRKKSISLSFCFSADIFNFFLRDYAVLFSSVRGNLFKNYSSDYGVRGSLLAFFHLLLLRRFDAVIAMSQSMSRQIYKYIGSFPVVIPNFIDEKPLEEFYSLRKNLPYINVVFVGALSARKNPMSLLHAVEKIKQSDMSIKLQFVGDGPVKEFIESEINVKNLQDTIFLHGHLDNPAIITVTGTVFVLPSTSEGISRACLESLHLGVPIVLRNVDANSELIKENVNGCLFEEDDDLPEAILKASKIVSSKSTTISLLPDYYRQNVAAKKHLDLFGEYCDK